MDANMPLMRLTDQLVNHGHQVGPVPVSGGFAGVPQIPTGPTNLGLKSQVLTAVCKPDCPTGEDRFTWLPGPTSHKLQDQGSITGCCITGMLAPHLKWVRAAAVLQQQCLPHDVQDTLKHAACRLIRQYYWQLKLWLHWAGWWVNKHSDAAVDGPFCG